MATGQGLTLTQCEAVDLELRCSVSEISPDMVRWIDTSGYSSAGYNRELYVESGEDRDAWVTELQEPIGPSSTRKK